MCIRDRIVIDVGRGMVDSLAAFDDPTMGAARIVCGLEDSTEVHVFDPVAGGAALLVIEVGDFPNSFASTALEVFTDPATGAPRLAYATTQYNDSYGHVRVYDRSLVVTR